MPWGIREERSGDLSLGVGVWQCNKTPALSWSPLGAVSLFYQVQDCFLLPSLQSPVNCPLTLGDDGLDPDKAALG